MRKLFVALLVISLSACGGSGAATSGEDGSSAAGSPEEAEQALYQKAVDAHDVVMPKYFDIEKVAQSLLSYQGKEGTTKEQSDQIILISKQLDDANDAMMDWMGKIAGNEPENLRATKSHEEIMKFWTGMDSEMKTVQKQMEESLALGKELLQSIEGEK